MELSLNETRVVGSLMEKAVTTPDQCPLTVHALTTACNQKSSREPVLSLDRITVQRTARALEEQGLVTGDENFKTGVVKYRQRFCNTPFSDQQFSEAEYAVVCLLLLRGPQTPAELRTRSGRLCSFADNDAVVETLLGLMAADRDGGPVVARLARVAGRRDHQYGHLFAGHIASVAEEASVPADEPMKPTRRSSPLADLEARVSALESELAEIRRRLST